MGPSTKPKPSNWGPHPADVDEVRAAFADVERGDLLPPQESAEYLKALLGDDSNDDE